MAKVSSLFTNNISMFRDAGSFINGSLLKKKLIPEDQMKLFDKLVPVFKLADRIVGNKMGLSVIHVGKNPERLCEKVIFKYNRLL